MIDKFYTIKTNKGYIHRDINRDISESPACAVKLYSKEAADEFKENIREELEPKIMLVTCKYEIEEMEECKNA